MKKIISQIAVCLLLTPAVSAQEYLAITNATIIQEARQQPLENGTILIRDGYILQIGKNDSIAIPNNSRIIDGTNKWIIPGLIEVHSHSSNKKDFQRGLALGVTTAHTLTSKADTTLDFQIWASKSTSPSPKLVQNPWMFSGSFPDNIAPNVWHVLKPETVTEAVEQVEHVKKIGFQSVKVFLDDGSIWFEDSTRFSKDLDHEVLSSIIKRAHELKMRVYGHAWDVKSYSELVDAGTDLIIHAPVDTNLSELTWLKMKENQMAWVTTLAVIDRVAEPFQYADRILNDERLSRVLSETEMKYYERRLQMEKSEVKTSLTKMATETDRFRNVISSNTKLARQYKIPIAIGSDCPIGLGTHLEMEILKELVGLPDQEILWSATTGGAYALKINEFTGSLFPKMVADLIILNSNPLEDIRNTRDISTIIKSGTVFEQKELLTKN